MQCIFITTGMLQRDIYTMSLWQRDPCVCVSATVTRLHFTYMQTVHNK